jgi:hypothetical protein
LGDIRKMEHYINRQATLKIEISKTKNCIHGRIKVTIQSKEFVCPHRPMHRSWTVTKR